MTGNALPEKPPLPALPLEAVRSDSPIANNAVRDRHPAAFKQTRSVHLELLTSGDTPDRTPGAGAELVASPDKTQTLAPVLPLLGLLAIRDSAREAVASEPDGDPRMAIFQSPHTGERDRHDAFAQIVGAYSGELKGHITRLSGSVELAQDIVQETFLAFVTCAGSFDNRSEAALKAWLFRAARNRLFNTQRALSYRSTESLEVRTTLPAGVTAAARLGAPEEITEHRETLQEMGEILEGLLPHEKEAIIRQSDGQTYQQIANAMGRSVPSIKTLLFRSREKFNGEMRARQA